MNKPCTAREPTKAAAGNADQHRCKIILAQLQEIPYQPTVSARVTELCNGSQHVQLPGSKQQRLILQHAKLRCMLMLCYVAMSGR